MPPIPTTLSIFHRWFIVAIGFLALALAFSARASLSLVMPVWTAELGWSQSFISGVASLALLVMAVVAPFAGRMVDQRGVRVTLGLGLILTGAGSLLLSLAESPLALVFAYGLLSAAGFGLVATHVVSTAIARRFDQRAGLAMGVGTSGATGGQFLLVPLIALLLESQSWRLSFLTLGTAALVTAGLLWWALQTEGRRPGSQATELGAKLDTQSLAGDLRATLKRPAFHILFWSFFLCGYTTTGVIETHFLPYASFCGIGPVPGATAYGTLSAVNLLGMILAGWLTDRVNRVALLGTIYLVRGLSFLLLMHVGSDYETLMAFAILFGAVDYATVPVTASLAASHLGLRVMGLAMGLISAGHAVGGAAGAFTGGYLFDLTNRYDWLWTLSLGLAVGAGLIVFLLRDQPTPTPQVA
ncbi:MFS transporter [Rhodospirillum sp. A1_3_36]|uniref:MFS transporter n=1 Tax=Rhodospirillum sp. A1_3_36 TaxID=3391666 RepID=UPI0039A72934